MTARDLIKGSLRLLGVLASGEEPSADEAQDALSSLNSLLDSWRNERLMAYAVLSETFPLVAGQKSYTIGPGGDFDTVRPVRIERVQFNYTQGGAVLPLNLNVTLLDLDQYNQFVVPDTASPIPMWMYANEDFPLRTLYLYTVPAIAETVDLYVWKQLASFDSLDASIALPPGYEKALRFALACDLAPEFGTLPSAAVVSGAEEAKENIKSVNNRSPLMQTDAALIAKDAGFNYLTGE